MLSLPKKKLRDPLLLGALRERPAQLRASGHPRVWCGTTPLSGWSSARSSLGWRQLNLPALLSKEALEVTDRDVLRGPAFAEHPSTLLSLVCSERSYGRRRKQGS